MINIRNKTIPVEVQENQNYDVVEISVDTKNVPLMINWAEHYCCLPKQMETYIEQVRQFSVRGDDVFLVTLPKCGTTWMQEAAWLLINNLSFEQALQEPSNQRCVYLELCGVNRNVKRNTIEEAAQMSSPRLIKSHLPANLIPQEIWTKQTKVIYVARNPKDAIVSFFHFLRGKGNWNGSIEIFTSAFLEGNLAYLPFWEHVLHFWCMRNEPNVFFTTYEAMMRDLKNTLKALCTFLEKPELLEDQLGKLLDHLSFEKMKANPKTNPTESIKAHSKDVSSDFQFMRRGIVGSYRDELPEHCIEAIDKWTEQKLKPYKISAEDIFGKF